jgi:hypothetical protein
MNEMITGDVTRAHLADYETIVARLLLQSEARSAAGAVTNGRRNEHSSLRRFLPRIRIVPRLWST